ncbi:uncharacterized protein CTRU02_211232 [Colletotrichum truncatum]|uniref:Uncharacterized protein n=2 Tax=Colletotrichum truncatum TaxID=5467 RepID=A0ACC3YR64_COLTU|nr:uncharacterized protein CTRU02_08406 [Colletotrichum truncatum]XP_036588001.1 uncharacterized protein CTRU02_02013 [Colletotrichum truncatum]KAF6790277.1 hypothetical protein CTRU02_08406 [Colletotrichum truncatum]KAF6799142.1 hypothetical protein CTRU02_02013 [Colletotrichum truncatum]
MISVSSYEPLDSDDLESTSSVQETSRFSSVARFQIAAQDFAAFITGFLLATTILLLWNPSTPSLEETYAQRRDDIARISKCGKSVKEAKAAGCVYDPGLLYWTQPYCSAEDIADEFIRNPVHQIYRDKEKNHPLNLSYILSGEFGEAYDRVNHHKGHCLNAWKVLTQAAATLSPETPEVLVPGMAVSWSHVVHCSEDVVVPNDKSKWRTKPYIKFWPGVGACHLLRAPKLPAYFKRHGAW